MPGSPADPVARVATKPRLGRLHVVAAWPVPTAFRTAGAGRRALAADQVGAFGPGVTRVGTRGAVDDVEARATEGVVAVAAIHHVCAGLAVEDVVAVQAVEDVLARTAPKIVGARAAGQCLEAAPPTIPSTSVSILSRSPASPSSA